MKINSKKSTKYVASKVTRILADSNSFSSSIYLNISSFNYHAGYAPVASKVMHLP